MRIVRFASILIFPTFIWATSLPVLNPSFEVLPASGLSVQNCGAGCAWSVGTNIPGWGTTDISNSGEFQPGTQDGNTTYFSSLDDGLTSAWSRSATIFQTVDAVIQVGTAYTLMVDLGWRNDKSFDASADLLINGQRYFATGATPVQGFWSTFTVTYIGTSADAQLPITIELNASGRQANFDNVRLFDPPVPEPAYGAVVGICLVALAACRRRWSILK